MSDTTGIFNCSVSSPDTRLLGGIILVVSTPEPTATFKDGSGFDIYSPSPTIEFIDIETILDGELPIPVLSMDSRGTSGSADIDIPALSVDINLNKTTGEFICDVLQPECYIESIYTIGKADVYAVSPDASIRTISTSGFFNKEVIAPDIIAKSTYTIGNISIEVYSPELNTVSSYTIGSISVEIPFPDFSVESTYTHGSLGITARKPSISHSFKYGTVGCADYKTPEAEIAISGFTSSFGFMGISSPPPRTRRF